MIQIFIARPGKQKSGSGKTMNNKLDWEDEKHFVALGMQTYGGGFVKLLGESLLHADKSNSLKIKDTFSEYWEEYLEKGKDLEIQTKSKLPAK